VEPESVETAAAHCGGSFTRARKLVDRRWLRRRDWIIRAMQNLMADNGPPPIRSWLALSEILAKKKDLIEDSLEIIASWLRDMLVVSCDPRQVVNQDWLDALSIAATHISPKQLIEQIDAVDRAQTALRSNTNVRLTMDAMVLQMAEACI
jgi:DNA polymerase-3 subunit delta'